MHAFKQSVIIILGLLFNKNGMSHQITQDPLQWRQAESGQRWAHESDWPSWRATPSVPGLVWCQSGTAAIPVPGAAGLFWGWCKNTMTRKRSQTPGEISSITGALSLTSYWFSLSSGHPEWRGVCSQPERSELGTPRGGVGRWCLLFYPLHSFLGSRQPFTLKAYEQERPPSLWVLRKPSWCLYSLHILHPQSQLAGEVVASETQGFLSVSQENAGSGYIVFIYRV